MVRVAAAIHWLWAYLVDETQRHKENTYYIFIFESRSLASRFQTDRMSSEKECYKGNKQQTCEYNLDNEWILQHRIFRCQRQQTAHQQWQEAKGQR